MGRIFLFWAHWHSRRLLESTCLNSTSDGHRIAYKMLLLLRLFIALAGTLLVKMDQLSNNEGFFFHFFFF